MLNVVGDSKLILQHIIRRKPPKASHLCEVYEQCRTIADKLHIVHWAHHPRYFIKMTDVLANTAMDTKQSNHVLAADITQLPQTWQVVLDSLEGDVNHWITMHSPLARPDTDEIRIRTLAEFCHFMY